MKVTSATVDHRYSIDGIEPTSWDEMEAVFAAAEIYQLTTILPDGMPHTVPVSGLLDETGFLFCTGVPEQKTRNLARDARASVSIGSTEFFAGVDIVLAGPVVRITDQQTLQWVSDTFISKYGEFWTFGVGDDALINAHNLPALVFRLVPDVAHSFTRGDRTAQTRYTFG